MLLMGVYNPFDCVGSKNNQESVGDDRINQAKLVNANANTGEVTVSGKGVKFSARTAKAESFAV